MSSKNFFKKLYFYPLCFKRITEDYIGSYITKKWIKSDGLEVLIVNDHLLSKVLEIYRDAFNNRSEKALIKNYQLFNNISYVLVKGDTVVGYCFYYVKPTFSFKGIKNISVIYSIAVNSKYRNMGMGEKLLNETISEMKLNNISSIVLYVNVVNIPAIALYKKIGFRIAGEVKDSFIIGELFYKMELELF